MGKQERKNLIAAMDYQIAQLIGLQMQSLEKDVPEIIERVIKNPKYKQLMTDWYNAGTDLDMIVYFWGEAEPADRQHVVVLLNKRIEHIHAFKEACRAIKEKAQIQSHATPEEEENANKAEFTKANKILRTMNPVDRAAIEEFTGVSDQGWSPRHFRSIHSDEMLKLNINILEKLIKGYVQPVEENLPAQRKMPQATHEEISQTQPQTAQAETTEIPEAQSTGIVRTKEQIDALRGLHQLCMEVRADVTRAALKDVTSKIANLESLRKNSTISPTEEKLLQGYYNAQRALTNKLSKIPHEDNPYVKVQAYLEKMHSHDKREWLHAFSHDGHWLSNKEVDVWAVKLGYSPQVAISPRGDKKRRVQFGTDTIHPIPTKDNSRYLFSKVAQTKSQSSVSTPEPSESSAPQVSQNLSSASSTPANEEPIPEPKSASLDSDETIDPNETSDTIKRGPK